MRQDNAGNILISRVLHGSVADRSKQLHAGDVIHEINGQTLRGKTIDDVADMMVSLVYCCRSSISLSLSPSATTHGHCCVQEVLNTSGTSNTEKKQCKSTCNSRLLLKNIIISLFLTLVLNVDFFILDSDTLESSVLLLTCRG